MAYRIWCEVWGGVTGHRAAWLEDNGEIKEFETHEDAEREANRLDAQIKGTLYRKANFSYTVREVA